MNIGQFVLTLIGTIIGTIVGGCVVIFTNWINAQRARRESVQDWYKQTYVTEGVDPLITFFVDAEFHWSRKQVMDLDTVPVAALAKMQVLLDSDVLTHMARYIQKYIAGTDLSTSKTPMLLEEIGFALLDLRKELLHLIPTQVNEKNYQLTSTSMKERFETIYKDLKHSFPKDKEPV